MFDIEFRGALHTVDPVSLVVDEWTQVAVELGAFAMRTGIEPDVEVKAAAVALIVLRRDPRYGALPFAELVDAPDVVRVSSPFDTMTLEQQLEYVMAGV